MEINQKYTAQGTNLDQISFQWDIPMYKKQSLPVFYWDNIVLQVKRQYVSTLSVILSGEIRNS